MSELAVEDSAAERSRWLRWMVAVVAAGTFFRLTQWAWGQPFWTDEASLLLNVAGKSARQLMGPLDFAQACPPLHLLMLRGLFVALGDSSHSLRLASLAESLVALPLFAGLSWRLLPRFEAVAVAALFAFSDRVLWHATEAKQYTGDSLAVIVLLWIALGLRRPGSPGGRLLLAAVVAAAAMWFSHATAFAFGAISLALAPAVFRERRGVARWALANAIFGASLVALYLLSVRVQRSPALVNMWIDQFVPWRRPLTIPVWLVRNVIGLCDYPVQGLGGVLLLVLCGCGIARLWRTGRLQTLQQSALARSGDRPPLPSGEGWGEGDWARRAPFSAPKITLTLTLSRWERGPNERCVCYEQAQFALAVLLLPLVLLFAASGIGVFPFNGNRVTFFTVPLILLLSGCGCEFWRQRFRGNLRYAGAAMLGVMVLETFGLAVFHVARPEPRTHILPAVAYLKIHRQPDEGIYIIGKATRTMFMWYWRGEAGPVLYKQETGPNLTIPWRRYWVVGIYQPKHGIAEMQADLSYAAHGATEVQRYQGDGSAAILFARP